MSILVIGECLVDLIVSPNGDTAAVPGGGPMNLARTIARLGVPVSLCSGISTDAFGRRISTLLSDDGVNTPVPTRSDLLTTLALAELDADGAATYRFYTEGTAAPDVMPADISVDSEVTVVAIGTLGLVLEPLATTVESVVAELPDHVLLFADPNCRPSTIADDRAYRDRVHRLLARTDVVKVSGDDLAFLSPATPTIDAARELLSYGPRVVLLTDGSSSVQITSLLAGRRARVMPLATILASHRIGAPANSASRPRLAASGENKISAAASTIPQEWMTRTATFSSSGVKRNRSLSARIIAKLLS